MRELGQDEYCTSIVVHVVEEEEEEEEEERVGERE